ncbi:helix-turn-helix transcriptional regulator [Apilactobacillus timberlakei]|uniref:XRE family transcriptional regulator n=1 Tax=Apilactobacillus timberlakei TaxID=2008380 RepID=A0ABY2YUS7_9LACO|nr:helix-turn-helix transcriptional regulator [Apilactobacillus timberlakei]TPR13293.1 XRE family transcriptional regulator [Apilactobacillus timberlakei]TPR14338.1 XRE family transcriptional regulator [Apilactobacillus timberlakei]TPR16591.1 XRE family transcriptional regulator [Apilactobacillus timberlakei]
MELSTKLKKARKDKKLTQEYVASQINVSRKTISSWENGRGKPNSSYLKQLNSIYNTNLQLYYTQNKHKNNNKYFYTIYFINIMLFILCLINLFTHLLTGIATFQLILTSFLFVKFRTNIFIYIKNNKIIQFVFVLLFIFFLIIIMNNMELKYNFSNILEDFPFFIGAIIHSLILTSSFFIITNYRKVK